MNSYSETQRFRQWWLWAIVLGSLFVPVGYTFYQKYMQHASYSMSDILSGSAVPASIIILFLSFKLDTLIDASGISYRFFPIQFSMKKIEWADVEKVYIRQYSPLAEYGGWGIRFGMRGTGMAYNISGKIGLQLELKTGKKILIGTIEQDRMKEYLNQLVKEKVITAKMMGK